jgi:hypothetical protein
MNVSTIRKYEPVLRFDQDENFFPMNVAAYIDYCSLHAMEGNQGVMVLPPSYVSLEDLPDFSSTDHFLVYANQQVVDEEKAEAMANYIERQKSLMGPDFSQFKRELKERVEALGVKLLQIWNPLKSRKEVFERALANYGGLQYQLPTYYYHVDRAGAYTVVHYWFFYA